MLLICQVKPSGVRTTGLVKATNPQTALGATLPNTAPPETKKKKKLFLTDGWQVPLTGVCIYMFRLNTGKQLPEEGFQKVIFLFY